MYNLQMENYTLLQLTQISKNKKNCILRPSLDSLLQKKKKERAVPTSQLKPNKKTCWNMKNSSLSLSLSLTHSLTLSHSLSLSYSPSLSLSLPLSLIKLQKIIHHEEGIK